MQLYKANAAVPPVEYSKIGGEALCFEWGFTRTFPGNQDVTGHSAYVTTATESDGAMIDGLLPPNFL